MGAVRLALGLGGHLLVGASFLWLPWASGRGFLAGREFGGAELARLARNSEALYSGALARPAASTAAAALFAVPALALAGAVLLLCAPWTSHPAQARRLSAMAGLLVVAITGVAVLTLVAAPWVGSELDRVPGMGALLAIGGGLVALTAQWVTGRRSPRNRQSTDEH